MTQYEIMKFPRKSPSITFKPKGSILPNSLHLVNEISSVSVPRLLLRGTDRKRTEQLKADQFDVCIDCFFLFNVLSTFYHSILTVVTPILFIDVYQQSVDILASVASYVALITFVQVASLSIVTEWFTVKQLILGSLTVKIVADMMYFCLTFIQHQALASHVLLILTIFHSISELMNILFVFFIAKKGTSSQQFQLLPKLRYVTSLSSLGGPLFLSMLCKVMTLMNAIRTSSIIALVSYSLMFARIVRVFVDNIKLSRSISSRQQHEMFAPLKSIPAEEKAFLTTFFSYFTLTLLPQVACLVLFYPAVHELLGWGAKELSLYQSFTSGAGLVSPLLFIKILSRVSSIIAATYWLVGSWFGLILVLSWFFMYWESFSFLLCCMVIGLMVGMCILMHLQIVLNIVVHPSRFALVHTSMGLMSSTIAVTGPQLALALHRYLIEIVGVIVTSKLEIIFAQFCMCIFYSVFFCLFRHKLFLAFN